MLLRSLKESYSAVVLTSNWVTTRRIFVSIPGNMQNAEETSSKRKKHSKSKPESSNNAQKEDKSSAEKAYASTLLLPKTKFPIWIEPKIVQDRYRERTTQDLYKWQVRRWPVYRSRKPLQ